MGAPSVRHHIPLAVLLAVAVRAPFWAEALRTPVDGDTAIIGLMARHLGRGTTMWGQPYGSPLEAWLAANSAPVERCVGIITDIKAAGTYDLEMHAQSYLPVTYAIRTAVGTPGTERGRDQCDAFVSPSVT